MSSRGINTISSLVKPSEVKINDSLFFEGRYTYYRETIEAAKFIVEFCQERGDWVVFTQSEIDAEYAKTPEGHKKLADNPIYDSARQYWGVSHLFCFYNLLKNPLHPDQQELIVRDEDGRFRVTDEFVLRCIFGSFEKSFIQRS